MKDNAYAWIQGLLLHRQHMGNESNGIQGIAYMDLAGFNVHTRGNAIAQINASGPGSRSEVVFSTLSPITLRVGGNLFADDFDNFVAFEELRETGWTTIASTQGSRISYSSFLELIRINPGRRYRLISKLNAQSSIFNGTLKISTAGCIVNCYGVNLTGHIGFHQNQVSNSNREVYAAVLRNGSYSEYLYLQTLKDGRFGVSFKRSGHFRFLFQTETSLRRAVELTIGTSEIHGIDISLVEGDLDGSNVIDLGDCQILFRNFGLSREECEWSEMDLDLDGEIGPGDFGIIASNFGMTGDQ